ncbi:MAG: lamin tail domain-containing protein [Verrucomicrobiota bacterium]
MKLPIHAATLLWMAAATIARSAPDIVNLPANNFTPASASAGVRVTTFTGLPPAVTLYYGPTDGGTTTADWAASVSLGAVLFSSTGNLPNLTPGTGYYYRAYATHASGNAWAPASGTFTTPVISAPVIVNREASAIGLNSATLNCGVTSTGNAPPSVTIYYGPADGGTTAASWAGSAPAGISGGDSRAVISGLTANTRYFFRALATNSAGTVWAPSSASFTSAGITPPVVDTPAVTHIRSRMATLNGLVTATGNETPQVTLYWGPADGGTTAANWQNAAVIGTSTDTFSRVLTGLTPGTAYFTRAYAANSAGGVWAAKGQSFATALTESPGNIIISEIHYDPLDPTKSQEFIELHNPTAAPVDLAGWKITGAVEYTFSAATIPAGGYFCVVQSLAAWPAVTLKAGPFTGKLKNTGEVIELRNAGNQLVNAVDYSAGFPWPTASNGLGNSMELLHPSLDNGVGASWRKSSTTTPTPGAVNSANLATASLAPPAIRNVKHTPEMPAAGVPVLITATVTDPDGVKSVVMRYQQVKPGAYIRKTDAAFNLATNWTDLPMLDDGTGGDAAAGDSIYTATIPATVQAHRVLARYQITVTDASSPDSGNSVRVPYADDEQPNFAYFVYNGVPAWSGAMRPTAFAGNAATPVQEYSPALLNAIEPWHLIANETDVINCQYNSTANFSGALVYRGKVYDHIIYNVRGQGSTTVSGKNKWGLKFSRARDFQAYDNWGRPYAETWNSLGLNACASPWASVNRGAAGIDEAAPFRLYDIAGVPSLRTNYVHWRVVRRLAEVNTAGATITGDPMGANIKGQYSGDLWGLYLAMEPTEGNFLDERGLEDGNIYSIEGSAVKKHQSDTQVSNGSDWNTFNTGVAATGKAEQWYRDNLDLPALYTFLALNRLVGNTDVRPENNHRYYHRPGDNRWVVMPYDLDMMFIAAHHWGGTMDGKMVAGQPNSIRTIMRWPNLALEYRNRCRELLSLAAGDGSPAGGQFGQLMNEYARMINPPGQELTWADLDAAMWNLHPRTTAGGANSGQSSHKGNFFLATYFDGTRGAGGPASTGSWTRSLPPVPAGGKFSDHEGLTQWFINFSTNTYPANGAAWLRKATNSSGGGTDNDLNRQKGYGYKYLEWESIYGGYADSLANPAASVADTAFPYTPVIFASGSAGFPANDLRFTSTAFEDPQGSATAAAVQWRIGEISSPGIPGYDATQPYIYELEEVWNSGEIALTTPTPAEIRIPASAVRGGHTYRARVRHRDSTGRWSFWSPPVQFIAGTVDTDALTRALRITEINYNPAAPTTAEVTNPAWNAAWNAQQFEFVEVTNISAQSVDLTDVRFTKGIDYDFPSGFQLAAGARVVVCKNPAAFAIRYGGAVPVAPGGFDPDSLSNSGEQLKLSYGAGTPIFDFTYGTDAPWPVSPDGDGSTLVLIQPEKQGLNHDDPYEWRASLAENGNPGADDRTSYAAWAAAHPGTGTMTADDDGDGMTNLMEFALGSNPLLPSPAALPAPGMITGAPVFTVTYNPRTAGAARIVEFSSDLSTWAESGTIIDRVIHPDGTMTDTWRAPQPVSAEIPRSFGRLKVTAP